MPVQQRAGLFGRVKGLADRIISPSTRKQFYENISTFAKEQPYVASFLALQLLISFTPLALFFSFSAGVLVLSLISAILFSLFWIGLALLILVPTLFVTVSLAVGLWIWAVSTLVIVRWMSGFLWMNSKGKMQVGRPNGSKKIVIDNTGGGYANLQGEVKAEQA